MAIIILTTTYKIIITLKADFMKTLIYSAALKTKKLLIFRETGGEKETERSIHVERDRQ